MVASQVVQVGRHARQIAAVGLNSILNRRNVGCARFAVGRIGQESINQIMRNGGA